MTTWFVLCYYGGSEYAAGDCEYGIGKSDEEYGCCEAVTQYSCCRGQDLNLSHPE
jgi:hypothetical protein